MALDVYFKDDVGQGIVAVAVAMLGAAVANGAANVEYCRGVADTSRAQALNYGLSWPALRREIWAALEDEGIDLGGLIGCVDSSKEHLGMTRKDHFGMTRKAIAS
jgi:hypothetical protein